MDSTNDPTLSQAPAGAGSIKGAVTGEFKNLISDVEELLSRVAHIKDPDIVRIRDNVMDALSGAKDALTDGADQARRQAQQVAGNAEDFVRANPLAALGIAALLGVVVGSLAARRS